MSGRVVHFEVPFDDGNRARNFYKEAFGWQLMEMPDMGYTIVMSGPSGDSGPTEAGFINGGMLSREQAATSGPVVVVDVEGLPDEVLVGQRDQHRPPGVHQLAQPPGGLQ